MSCGIRSQVKGRTLGETGTEQTGNLLDEGLRRQESVVLLGKLLHKLLVLVEPTRTSAPLHPTQSSCHALLEVIHGHVLEVDLLGTVDVGGIGENADGHAGAGDVGEP